MSERKQHWDKIYGEKSHREVSWYQQEPTLSLNLIEHCHLTKDQAIIDVGGGASTLVDKLLAQGYRRLSVLDITDHALQQARQRLGQAAAQVTWICEDITCFKPPQPYALWHDRAVFHFLTAADDRQRYVEVLKTALPAGGFLILAAFAIGGPTMCSGLDIVQYDAEKLCLVLGDEFELLEQSREEHLTPAGKAQAFNCFRFVRR